MARPVAAEPGAWPTSKGTTATSGTEARSCSSSTAKASRPAAPFSRSRSLSIGRTMAVEERARPSPITRAAVQLRPVSIARPPSTAPVTSNCIRPRPNTDRRMTQIRCARSSSPIRNSSISTPSSEIWVILLTSRTRPRPDGPISTPASK